MIVIVAVLVAAATARAMYSRLMKWYHKGFVLLTPAPSFGQKQRDSAMEPGMEQLSAGSEGVYKFLKMLLLPPHPRSLLPPRMRFVLVLLFVL